MGKEYLELRTGSLIATGNNIPVPLAAEITGPTMIWSFKTLFNTTRSGGLPSQGVVTFVDLMVKSTSGGMP